MKLDRNGYRPSLFATTEDECYICGCGGDLARHEVLHGPNRSNAKRYGLWINVCPRCHDDIHQRDNEDFLYLKEEAQQLFEEEYIDKDFLSIFGRNYL